MMLMNLVVILLMLAVVGAVIALWTRDLLSTVIAIGVVGFAATDLFLLLRAPDLAITEAVVDVLVLLVLIRSVAFSRGVVEVNGTRSMPGTAVAAAFLAVLLVFGVIALRELEPFGKPVALAGLQEAAPAPGAPLPPPSHAYIQNGMQETGAANIVTAILFDYRGYDTLGEATVIFVSVLGAVALLRRKGRKEEHGPARA